VKKIGKKYKLPNKTVYELITQYNGLVDISEKQVDTSSDTLQPLEGDEEPETKQEGIKIDVLIRYTRILADKHPYIIPKILKGVGVDTGARNPRANLKSFLKLNWILEYGVVGKDELIQFWTRILDPENTLTVEKSQVIDLFDKLSKGRFSKSDNEQFSYAQDVWEFFKNKDWITQNGENLDITQLRKDLEEDLIDINVFADIFSSGFDPNMNQNSDE